MTTSMLMFIDTTWTSKAMDSPVIFYALAFGGTGQLLAGLLDVSTEVILPVARRQPA